MNIAIVNLVRGRPASYHKKLVKTVGIKFNEKKVLNKKIPSHITLKFPYEVKDIKEMEEIIKRLASQNQKFKIEIDGFGNFEEKVIYLKVKNPKKIKAIQRKLLGELKTKGNKYDKRFVPHITISNGKKKNFTNILNYLNPSQKPYFSFYFDNITILKKSNGQRKVYKEFKLK
ncbi:2'-5' RNA ligase family protein [Candidatus Pacearchaeota archaeon]|nr:2'-5' RNA ligase family protein [Candidatus Pacearchaeota archaeon]